jgi:hypothetical protein
MRKGKIGANAGSMYGDLMKILVTLTVTPEGIPVGNGTGY